MAGEDSGEKTEAATPRRLQRAREAGQVAVSREGPTLAVLAASALVLVVYAPATAATLARALGEWLARCDDSDPVTAVRQAAWLVLRAAAPFVVASLLASVAAVLAQTGGLVHLGALRPDFSRLSPSRGLGRIVSLTALLELGKSLAKLAAATAILYRSFAAAWPDLPRAVLWRPATLIERAGHEVFAVLVALLAAQFAITGFDVLRARLSLAGDLRMTRQEVREEHKEMEGDPLIKARVRRIRAQRARRRMLRQVPKAAVVITNPTHFAVALAYERGSAAAPRVVAKGTDEVAARIRAIAREHNVPLVANPPLARALYPVDLDAEIPRELFQAVAEIIAYLWGLRRRTI